MKRKELKQLAQKIANAQKICSSSETTDKEKRAAELEIEKLTSHVDSLDDIFILDELVMDMLN